jgi:hypothetical protein
MATCLKIFLMTTLKANGDISTSVIAVRVRKLLPQCNGKVMSLSKDNSKLFTTRILPT